MTESLHLSECRALIVHPIYQGLRALLQDTVDQLARTHDSVDKILNHVAKYERVKSWITRCESVSADITALESSILPSDGPKENITGVTRSLRSFLDGDASTKDQVTLQRCKHLYQKLASYYHTDKGRDGSDEKMALITTAYRAKEVETLYLMFCETFSRGASTFPDEIDLLNSLCAKAEEKLMVYLSSARSFEIASEWVRGGQERTINRIIQELVNVHQRMEEYKADLLRRQREKDQVEAERMERNSRIQDRINVKDLVSIIKQAVKEHIDDQVSSQP